MVVSLWRRGAPKLHARLREQLFQLASSQVIGRGSDPGVVGLVGERHSEQQQPRREQSGHRDLKDTNAARELPHSS